jgi:NAD-specific glutamate dehydrogenase
METPFVIALIVIVLAIIMKLMDSSVDILIMHRMNMLKIENEIDILKDEVNKLNQQLKPFIKGNEYSLVTKRVDDNWNFLSEEISDIYASIKYINTEIMFIKDKIC